MHGEDERITKFNVHSNSIQKIQLNRSMVTDDQGITTKIMHIYSDQNITLEAYECNENRFNAYQYYVLPRRQYGQQYLLLENYVRSNSELLVLGITNQTIVQIQYMTSISNLSHNKSFLKSITRVVHRYEAIHVRQVEDSPGIIITATNDIGVYVAIYHPNQRIFRDSPIADNYHIQAVFPINDTGNVYFAANHIPTTKTSNASFYRLIATSNNTKVAISSALKLILSKAEFMDIKISRDNPTFVSCTLSCLFVYYEIENRDNFKVISTNIVKSSVVGQILGLMCSEINISMGRINGYYLYIVLEKNHMQPILNQTNLRIISWVPVKTFICNKTYALILIHPKEYDSVYNHSILQATYGLEMKIMFFNITEARNTSDAWTTNQCK